MAVKIELRLKSYAWLERMHQAGWLILSTYTREGVAQITYPAETDLAVIHYYL